MPPLVSGATGTFWWCHKHCREPLGSLFTAVPQPSVKQLLFWWLFWRLHFQSSMNSISTMKIFVTFEAFGVQDCFLCCSEQPGMMSNIADCSQAWETVSAVARTGRGQLNQAEGMQQTGLRLSIESWGSQLQGKGYLGRWIQILWYLLIRTGREVTVSTPLAGNSLWSQRHLCLFCQHPPGII